MTDPPGSILDVLGVDGYQEELQGQTGKLIEEEVKRKYKEEKCEEKVGAWDAPIPDSYTETGFQWGILLRRMLIGGLCGAVFLIWWWWKNKSQKSREEELMESSNQMESYGV